MSDNIEGGGDSDKHVQRQTGWRGNIFLFDDDIDFLKPFKSFIEREGYKVLAVSDVESASEILRYSPFDGAFIDINDRLSRPAGLELITIANEWRASKRIIGLTGVPAFHDEVERAGGIYFSKPPPPEQTREHLAAIEQCVRENRFPKSIRTTVESITECHVTLSYRDSLSKAWMIANVPYNSNIDPPLSVGSAILMKRYLSEDGVVAYQLFPDREQTATKYSEVFEFNNFEDPDALKAFIEKLRKEYGGND